MKDDVVALIRARLEKDVAALRCGTGSCASTRKPSMPYQIVAPFMRPDGGMNELDGEQALSLEAAWSR